MSDTTRAARFQVLPNADPAHAHVVILPVAHDATVCGRKGTAQAPSVILSASEELEYYEEDEAWSPFLHMRVSVLEEMAPGPCEAAETFHARLTRTARLHVRGGIGDGQSAPLLIGLGGEHSITPSLVAGAMPERGTVVMLDAHADLRATYQGTPYSHACAAHGLRALGHDVLIVGLRSLAHHEADRIANDEGVSAFSPADVREPVAAAALHNQIAALSGPVWLTIDMDVFDAAVAPSVGTPQPDGLAWHEVVGLCRELIANRRVALMGADIVETIPEPNGVTQIAAAKLAQKLISSWGKRMGHDKLPLTGSQAGIDIE